jgi:hypothetical protein
MSFSLNRLELVLSMNIRLCSVQSSGQELKVGCRRRSKPGPQVGQAETIAVSRFTRAKHALLMDGRVGHGRTSRGAGAPVVTTL